MAWTSPETWSTGELVTAAKLNTNLRDNLLFLAGWQADLENQDVNGFTNTSYADLDALTAAPFSNPVAVTVETGTAALVIISVARIQQVTAGTGFVSYRVSGATTLAGDDDFSIRNSSTAVGTASFPHVRTGLTAGSNTFEMQARTSSNSANLSNPTITVIPLP